MKAKLNIIRYLQKNGATTIDALATKLKFSRQYIHKLIDVLIAENKIEKTGSAPHVYYSLKNELEITSKNTIHTSPEKEQFLKEHFILIDATGNLLQGIDAMKYWCNKQNLSIDKTITEYIETRNKYNKYFDNNFIDGLSKLTSTKGIGEVGVDGLFYLDFYAIERFGKTKLGTLMHYAKQGQNKTLMKMVTEEIKNRVHYFIAQKQIDAVLFVPPTIKRSLQIMSFIEKNLHIDLPKAAVKKINNPIIIPQKALSNLFERVANAKKTFIIPEQKKYNHVLIIDDAIGSGATINEIALKLKEKSITKIVTGIAITGSYKGFEVISEI